MHPIRRVVSRAREEVLIGRLVLIAVVASALAFASPALGGGISDEPCPNVAGEHTNTCPAGTVGTPYSVRFRESDGSGCGPGRQTFHVDSGVAPPGVTLAGSGLLSGVPTRAGRFQFYVEMREPADDPATCAGKRTQKQFTLWVHQPLSAASPSALRRGEVGVPYRLKLRVRGGSGTVFWNRIEGRLPRGLDLRRNGTLVGTPRQAGRYPVRLLVRDTVGRTAEWSGVVRVAARLAAKTQHLPNAVEGRRYDVRLKVRGGVAPRRWTLVRGQLPRGLRFLPRHGRIVGTPRETGRVRVTVQVRDGLRANSLARLTLVVRAR